MTTQTKILLFIKYHLEYSFSIVGLWIYGFVTGLTGRKTYEYLDRLLKISLHLPSYSAIPLWIIFCLCYTKQAHKLKKALKQTSLGL